MDGSGKGLTIHSQGKKEEYLSYPCKDIQAHYDGEHQRSVSNGEQGVSDLNQVDIREAEEG
jgi:hypothetical protein